MKNLKTRVKLLLGFGLVAVLLLVVGVLAFYGLTTMNNITDVLYYNYTKGIEAASGIESETLRQQSLLRGLYVNMDDADTMKQLIADLDDADKTVKEQAAHFAEAMSGLNFSGQANVTAFDSAYANEYLPLAAKIIEHARAGNVDAVGEDVRGAKDLFAALDKYTDDIVDAINDDADAYNTAGTVTADRLTLIIVIIAVVAIVISVVLGLYISNLIAKPLSKLSELAEEVSVGNVDVSIDDDRRDEIGMLAGSFKHMIDAIHDQSEFIGTVSEGDFRSVIEVRSDKDRMNQSLNKLVESNNEMISKIRMSSEQVSSASSQIAQAAQTLASGSTEQAASVDEFTATLNDILEQTNKNAQLSIEALEGVNDSVKYMNESSELMGELLTAMRSIDESSQNITKVIKTIEDIAFQTNILALNAAVEAAHAGQHGRGFAVVAEEVRSLASDSSVAAKETAELIESSARRVQEGNDLVAKTNVCMQNVSDSALKVQQAVTYIADASQQQAVAIAELHQGLEQISQVVQANSATSEQTAASAQEMSSQASLLDETVAEFRLSDKYDRRLGSGTRAHSLAGASTSKSTSTSYSESDFSSSGDFGKY